MASYTTGYDDEQFEQAVSQTLHCIICTNDIKDPVMCRHNEHVFCRGCITRHLTNSRTCPTCMEPLTVDTLKVPRTVANLLSELKIRCEFFNRGCERFIELGDLERHVASCGFAPAVCTNEGCNLEVNKQDLLHHETAVCEQRRVKCHSCNDIRQEMNTVKMNLTTIDVKIDKNMESIKKKIDDNNAKIVAKVELVQQQLDKQEEGNRQLNADNEEMKNCLNKLTKQLERIVQQISREVEPQRKGITEAVEMNGEPKVVVAEGASGPHCLLNSVEMFSFTTKTWTPLRGMKKCHANASSVVHDNEIFVAGGFCEYGIAKTIEKLSLNAVRVDQSISWENVPAELPEPIRWHCTVVYKGRLIMIGGDGDNGELLRFLFLRLTPGKCWLPCRRENVSTVQHRLMIRSLLLVDSLVKVMF